MQTNSRRCVTARAIALALSVAACGAPSETRSTLPDPEPSPTPRSGVLVTYRDGTEIARERWRDDGQRIESEIQAGGQTLRVRLDRESGEVRMDGAGLDVARTPEDGAVGLENLHWAAYAALADREPGPVRVWIPSRDATVDAALTRAERADGGQTLTLAMASGLVVEVELDAEGSVTAARVPTQRIEVLPEGAAPTASADREAPADVVAAPVEVTRDGVTLRGELWLPAERGEGPTPVALWIAGSGPTDRDGNGVSGLRTDAYRMVAEALARRGIATLRYDKRGVGRSGTNFDVAATVLDDFVADAGAMVAHLRGDRRLGPVTLIGHSEGGLIALRLAHRLAEADAAPAALVLVSTAGRPLGELLREQLGRQLDEATLAELDRVLSAMRAGESVDPVPDALAPLFAPPVRAFLRSAIDVDPVALLADLAVPTRVVQGETDIQVSMVDAERLAAARPDVALIRLPETNHVLKREPEATLQQPSYADPSMPLAPGVVDAIAGGVVGASED